MSFPIHESGRGRVVIHICVCAWAEAEAEGRCSMSCPTTSHLIPSLSLSLELFSTEAAWPESPWAPSLGMGTRDQNSDLPACVAEIPAHWAISPAQSSPYSLNAPGGLSFTLEIADNRHTPPFFWWLSLGSSVISRGRLFFWTQYGHLLGFFRLIILVLQKMNWLPSCQDGLPFPWLQATGQSKMDQEDEIALNKKTPHRKNGLKGAASKSVCWSYF